VEFSLLHKQKGKILRLDVDLHHRDDIAAKAFIY